MKQEVEYTTNRLDLFCLKWLGSDSDETRRLFIRWNLAHFRASPTFWLPIGRLFWISPPDGS